MYDADPDTRTTREKYSEAKHSTSTDRRKKKAYLLDKNLPAQALLMVLKRAKEERESGCQVLIANMKKNKKFQKEQLSQEGYEEITDCYPDSVDRL